MPVRIRTEQIIFRDKKTGRDQIVNNTRDGLHRVSVSTALPEPIIK